MRAVAFGLVAAIALTSCTDGPLSRADLAGDPAASLRMAGADDLGAFGSERQRTLESEQGATDGHIFGTMATSESVRAFYTSELKRLGWKGEGASKGISTVETEVWWWCKPKAIVRIGVKDKQRAFDPAIYKGRSYATVFDVALIANYSGVVGCPEPASSP